MYKHVEFHHTVTVSMEIWREVRMEGGVGVGGRDKAG